MARTPMKKVVRFTLDGNEVEAVDGETIWQVAHRLGTEDSAPVLRARARLSGRRQLPRMHGGGRRQAGAGDIVPAPGVVVHTATERAEASRRMVMEMLVADQPAREVAHQHDSRLWQRPGRVLLRSKAYEGSDGGAGYDERQ